MFLFLGINRGPVIGKDIPSFQQLPRPGLIQRGGSLSAARNWEKSKQDKNAKMATLFMKKGTFDAIALCPEDAMAKRATYIDNVSKMVKPGMGTNTKSFCLPFLCLKSLQKFKMVSLAKKDIVHFCSFQQIFLPA